MEFYTQGHASVVRELLSSGADVDHADNDGWTPLRSAAWAGHVDVVDILLAQTAQVIVKSSRSFSVVNFLWEKFTIHTNLWNNRLI